MKVGCLFNFFHCGGVRACLTIGPISPKQNNTHTVAQLLDKGMELPSSLTFRWLWFGVAVAAGHAWAYGSKLMPSLLPKCLHWFWPRRQFLYFLLYTLLLGGSISVTGSGAMLKRQMAHLAGLHFALFLIVGLGSGYIASEYLHIHIYIYVYIYIYLSIPYIYIYIYIYINPFRSCPPSIRAPRTTTPLPPPTTTNTTHPPKPKTKTQS